jgi:hypothetical protein
LVPAETTAPSFRSTGSTLLNEEGAFDSDVPEAQLARDAEKESLRCDEVVRRQLAKGDKNKSSRHPQPGSLSE